MNTPCRLVIVVCCLLFLISDAPGQTLPFFDDFNDGNATDGSPGTWLRGATPPGGERDASGGDFVATHTAEMSTYVQELNGLKDLSIRTQLRFLQVRGNQDFVSVWARSPLDPIRDPAAYWGGIASDGSLYFGYNNSSNVNTILGTRVTSLDPVNADVLLQFDVVGDRLSLFAWQEGDARPNAPQLTTRNRSLTDGGQVGFTLAPSSAGVGGPASVALRYYSVVPEPSCVVLLATALTAILCLARRSQ